MKTANHCIRRLPLLLATTLGAAALQAHAGLYPPAAPPDSAFIRVFNDTAQGRLDAQLGDKKVPDAAPMDASAYVFMPPGQRSEEHTSELQSLMRISYAVFCLKKKTTNT